MFAIDCPAQEPMSREMLAPERTEALAKLAGEMSRDGIDGAHREVPLDLDSPTPDRTPTRASALLA